MEPNNNETTNNNPEETTFSEKNPDPNSNHEWYAQFDPNSKEYHGSKDTRPVPVNAENSKEFGNKVPETMATNYPAGMTEQDVLNQVDLSKDDPTCQEIQVGYKFCGDLKKKLADFGKQVQARAELILKKQKEATEGEEQKTYPIVSEKIKTLMDELKAFYTEGAKNSHVDSMDDLLNEFWAKVDSLGSDADLVKKDFNLFCTNTTRLVFKVQNATMAKLKARKEELQNVNKEN